MDFENWKGFESGTWTKEINVRSFIKHNFTPYDGNEEFLAVFKLSSGDEPLSGLDIKNIVYEK